MSEATRRGFVSGQQEAECARRNRRAAGHDPAKRRQIIEGARRVFISMGFDAASMNDITREAGVSKGTIYVYFANKEELFEALMEDERCAIFQNLYEVLEGGEDLRGTLLRFGTALSAKITSEQVILAQRTVIGVSERIPELGARFYEQGSRRGHERLVVFLKQQVDRGLLAIDDIDVAGYQLSDLCLSKHFRQRLFAYRSDAPEPWEIEQMVKAGVDVFLKAYGTRKLFARERRRAGAA